MDRMTEEEFLQFIDTTASTALANKALLACMLSGEKFSFETAVGIAAQMIDPNSPHFERLAVAVGAHLEQTLKLADGLKRSEGLSN